MRDRETAEQRRCVQAIRQGAAAISELLANGSLDDEALDQAAQFLMNCRTARSEIERGSIFRSTNGTSRMS